MKAGSHVNPPQSTDCRGLEDDLFSPVARTPQGGYAPEYVSVCTAETMPGSPGERQWDVITSDYNMPGFSALAALKLLQESGLDLPFIVVSGKIGEDQAVAAMKAVPMTMS